MLTSALRWWTKCLSVPLVAALIGGGFALAGGWFGARCSADKRRLYAREIAAGIRRDELEAQSLKTVDDALARLEQRLRDFESVHHWGGSPDQMPSEWSADLLERLREVDARVTEAIPRIGDRSLPDQLRDFAPGLEPNLNAAWEQRRLYPSSVSTGA